MTEEHKKKIGDALRGIKRGPMTEEHKKKIGIASKNRPGGCFSRESRIRAGKATKGRVVSEETRKKMSIVKLGKKRPLEVRLKMSQTALTRGVWNKGTARVERKEEKKIRQSIELRLWREAVFARDNWTCQKCGKVGGVLNAHHIKGFTAFAELRTSIENGVTLCKECHAEHHKQNGYD